MLITSALLGALIVSVTGTLIFWPNPTRIVNRVVFTCSFNIAAWLLALHLAITIHEGLIWLRIACAVGALVPLHFWLVKESIANDAQGWVGRVARRSVPWVVISVLLTITPFTDLFIPSHSTGDRRIFGQGYYGYIIVDLGLYMALLIDAFRTLKRVTGGRRLELQVWLLGGCLMTSIIMTLMGLNAVTGDPRFIRPQPLVVLVFYAGTAVAITMQRIFDARQMFLVVSEKCVLVGAVALVAFLMDSGLERVLPEPIALILTTAIALWVATQLNRRLDRMFRFYPEATAARQAAFAVARREQRIEGLERGFLEILKGWGQTEHALVLAGGSGSLRGGSLDLSEDCPMAVAMRSLRWATPERLARERPTPDRDEVARFLAAQKLGVIVSGEGPTLKTLVGVGVPASRRPFTYPQVTQLMELTSIVEGALERAHFSVKAQHAEQLATVGLLGASLAHEIRNPLVTIKTFVQLLPRHHQDQNFRDKFFGLIGEEVTRIDRLTEQLLDLASPRAYHAQDIELHPTLHSSLELVTAKATDKRIRFLTDFRAAPDRAFTDASAARQVLLNLCFNAIQAVETIEGDRWVKISTRNVAGGIEMRIEDSGPGIAEDIRPRLFQPFQSTKSSGFGLGLAICSDILAGLDATISVDPAAPGQGASFRVVFPSATAISP